MFQAAWNNVFVEFGPPISQPTGPFDAPPGRTREVVEICRQVWRRENVDYDGKHYQLPLPADRGTGLGKSLHLINHPVREHIPITIAALGPRNVELTAGPSSTIPRRPMPSGATCCAPAPPNAIRNWGRRA